MTASAVQERPLYGAALIIGGMCVIGFIDNFVAVFAEHAGLWQFHLMRSLIAVPAIFLIAAFAGVRLKPLRWRWAMLRTALLAGSMVLYFGSLPMAPIAQVAAGIFTSPIWVLVFSVVLFGVPVGPRRIGAVAIGFLGAMLILEPWRGDFTAWSLMPVAAGMLYALSMIVTRRHCAEEPTLGLNALFFSTLGLLGAAGAGLLNVWPQPGLMDEAPFLFAPWAWPLSLEAWGLLGMQAFGSILAVVMLTRGYQSADTSRMILFDYTFLISASVTAWAVFGQVIGATTLIGIVLIVGAGAFIAVRSAETSA